MFKRALISVSDKTGLAELLKPLVAQGLEIVSTGGTSQFLRENGFKIIDVSETTGFPEVMDGRVKTLHPHVHMGLLARAGHGGDAATLEKFGVKPFDLVVVNLYPFEQAARANAAFPELIEKIDVGGPSMLRAAAKSFERVAVLCDPSDYGWFLENRGSWSAEKSRRLAAKVYAHTSLYDSLIARKLGYAGPETQVLGGRLVQTLRYGENPHQTAAWYRLPDDVDGLASARVLQGKELSYNNLLDLEASSAVVRSFDEPAAVAVKHNNPCGAAIGETVATAVERALKADPVSVFGGIVALNRPVDAASAKLLGEVFLECVVAPDFTPDALEIFAKKKNLRLLSWPGIARVERGSEVRSVAGGFLMQSADRLSSDAGWVVHGEAPSTSRRADLRFGERVCAGLKSNAIALVSEGKTVGLGMGQVNRVDAVDQALQRWKAHHPDVAADKVALISDAFFPFPDSIEKAAAAGIRWILQPGGSVRDEEVLGAAKKLGVNVILTGERHFRH